MTRADKSFSQTWESPEDMNVFGSPTPLLDERCRQLETNLLALRSDKRLAATLTHLDTELTNAAKRSIANGATAAQRLDDKVNLLDKYFDKCVTLLAATDAPPPPRRVPFTPQTVSAPHEAALMTPVQALGAGAGEPSISARKEQEAAVAPDDSGETPPPATPGTSEASTASAALREAEEKMAAMAAELEAALARCASLEERLGAAEQAAEQEAAASRLAEAARAAAMEELSERCEQLAEEVDRSSAVEEQLAAAQSELAVSREAERFASLQARMQSMRAQENASEAAQLQSQMDRLREEASSAAVSKNGNADQARGGGEASEPSALTALGAPRSAKNDGNGGGTALRAALGALSRQLVREQMSSYRLVEKLAHNAQRAPAVGHAPEASVDEAAADNDEDEADAAEDEYEGRVYAGCVGALGGTPTVSRLRGLLGAAVRLQLNAHTRLCVHAMMTPPPSRAAPPPPPRPAAVEGEEDALGACSNEGAASFDPRARCTTFPDFADLELDEDEAATKVEEGPIEHAPSL